MRWSRVAVLAPSFYISRLLGVAPLLVKKNQDGTLEFVINGHLRIVCLLIIVGMANMSFFITIDYIPKIIKSQPSLVTYALCTLLSCYGSMIVLVTAFFYHRYTLQAFNEVYALSCQLPQYLGYSRFSSEAFFIPTILTFALIRFLLLAFSNSNTPVTQLILYYYTYLIYLGAQSLATGFLFYLETFFKWINAELSDIGLNLCVTSSEIEIWLILQRLKYLRQVHNRICNLCDIVCERFSLDLFLTFGIIVILLISRLYVGAWAQIVTYMWLLDMLHLSHDGVLILRLAHICYRSDCVMKQNKITSAKVQSLMTAYLPAEIKQEIYDFMLQTMLRKIEITACGFYGLRMGTITTLIHLLTTYLALVINFFSVT